MSEFGKYIREARERDNLSLGEAAKLISCTKTYLWELESGRSQNPTITILAGISSAYGLTLGDVAEAAAYSGPWKEFHRAVRELRHAKCRVDIQRERVKDITQKP